MTDEYITKAQAIEVAESLRNIAGDDITDAFIKGIEEKQAWISTKDRMPEEELEVIINTIDSEVFEAFFCKGYWENDNSFWARPKDVTHWMPMPEPPKE